jgi:hypothetical protein
MDCGIIANQSMVARLRSAAATKGKVQEGESLLQKLGEPSPAPHSRKAGVEPLF